MPHVRSVLALSAIVTSHGSGKRSREVGVEPADRAPRGRPPRCRRGRRSRRSHGACDPGRGRHRGAPGRRAGSPRESQGRGTRIHDAIVGPATWPTLWRSWEFAPNLDIVARGRRGAVQNHGVPDVPESVRPAAARARRRRRGAHHRAARHGPRLQRLRGRAGRVRAGGARRDRAAPARPHRPRRDAARPRRLRGGPPPPPGRGRRHPRARSSSSPPATPPRTRSRACGSAATTTSPSRSASRS